MSWQRAFESGEKAVSESEKAMALSGGLAVVGVVLNGPAGLGFLLTPIQTPLWFLLAAFVMPTGEALKLLRKAINRRIPKAGKAAE